MRLSALEGDEDRVARGSCKVPMKLTRLARGLPSTSLQEPLFSQASAIRIRHHLPGFELDASWDLFRAGPEH